jgi:hypothetical protein
LLQGMELLFLFAYRQHCLIDLSDSPDVTASIAQ